MAGPRPAPSLLDLSPDLLLRIVSQVPFRERLRVPEVCSRLSRLLAGPSEAWRAVETTLTLDEHEDWPPGREALEVANTPVQNFFRWLHMRLTGVEELRLAVDATRLQLPEQRRARLPLDLLFVPGARRLKGTSLPVAKLSIEWHGDAVLDIGAWMSWFKFKLPHLKKLSFPAGTRLHIDTKSLPALTDFGMIDGVLTGELDGPWLPPSLTMLALAAVQLGPGLPAVLDHLPRLQSLILDHNFELGHSELDGLATLSGLQELNLSECALEAFPRQISRLRQLRILYLHNTFVDAAELAPSDWDALRPLRHLIFLSISNNSLHRVPDVVEGLTQLQGLHLEDNLITYLPPTAPVLGGLVELLIDWRTALGSPAALRSATRLTRLVLNDHLALELGPGAHPGAVGELLGALGALPMLRQVDDVVPLGLQGMVSSISAPVAHAMWQLGRACPAVQLGMMPATNTGWTLSSLLAALPHNDGLALLPAAEGLQGAEEDAEEMATAEQAVQQAQAQSAQQQPGQQH